MDKEKEELFRVLDSLDIEFEEFHHPPVYTVDEAVRHWKDIDATHCKNLFFRDKKGRNHYLVIIRHDRQLDIKGLGKNTGAGNLSFASEDRLMRYLSLPPGSVSPFGLINDPDDHVQVFIDHRLRESDKLGFHPNDNSSTIVIRNQDFVKFLKWTGNKFRFIDLDT